MRHVHSMLLVAVGAVAVAAPSPEVVARVGTTDVTADQLKGLLDTLGPADRAALAKDPALLSQLVRSHLARQLVLKEAVDRKFQDRPEVKAQLERAREQALIDLYLGSVSRPPAGYPSDAEVQAAYDANRSLFEVGKQYRVSQIFIALPKGADAGAEDKARARLDRVVKAVKQKDADFAAIARADSEDQASARSGGDLGWLTEAQLVPGIRPTVVALAQGAVSDPIRLDDGWHVVKVMETRAPSVRPLSEVKSLLVGQLRSERAQAARQAYLARLIEQMPPVINELELAKLLPQ